jgi:hypothetical protein
MQAVAVAVAVTEYGDETAGGIVYFVRLILYVRG